MKERLVFGYGARNDTGNKPEAESVRESVATSIVPSETVAVAPPRRAVREKTDWAFVGLMTFTGLLYFRPQDTIPPLAVLHLAELAALGALAAMVAGRLGRGLPATRVTTELLAVLALGGVILATAPFSIWMGGAIGTFTGLYLKVMLIYVLLINTLTSPRRVEQFTWLIVIATGYIASRTFFDYVRGINLIENGRVQGAIGGMFKNPNDLALNLVSVFPLAASLALRPVSPVRRLVAVGCMGLILAAVVASQSRSGALGLAAMVIVLGTHLVRRRPGLAFAGVLALALALPLVPASYWERLSSITDGSRDQTGSREARSILLREAYAAFLENPLTGVGAGQFMNYKPDERQEAWRETHNVLLQVAAEIGVLGLAVFVFLIGCALYGPVQTRRLLRRIGGNPSGRRGPPPASPVISAQEHAVLEAHSAAMTASLIGWFVSALFASVAYHWTFYYLLALAVTPRDIIADRLQQRQPKRRFATAAVARVAGVRA